jgi:tetratricopeptide (TPR) repeat protein
VAFSAKGLQAFMKRGIIFFSISVVLLMQACSSAETEPQDAPNLFSSDPLCVASTEESSTEQASAEEHRLLPELVEANALYEEKKYPEAVQAYEHVLVVSDVPEFTIQALIGLAKLRLMNETGLVDVEVANMVMQELERRLNDAELLEEYYTEVSLLNSILGYERSIRQLRKDNRELREELGRKDEAIKSLKELTVGPAE